jgi:hypothetical protein
LFELPPGDEKSRIVQATVDRYNLVMKFLQSLEHSQDFAAYLIQHLVPCLKADTLLELDHLLQFVERAVKCHQPSSEGHIYEQEIKRKLTAFNTEAMMAVMKD